MKIIRLKCELLSPIHIGTGEEIDPLSYIITGGRLYRISFEKVLTNLSVSERAEFEQIIDTCDSLKLRESLLKRNLTKEDVIYSVAVTPQVEAYYQANFKRIENQLIIYPYIRTACRPFIPGSAFKGALRTAVLSETAKQAKLPAPKTIKEEMRFEGKIMGYQDAKDDPFRAVKVRDTVLEYNDIIVRPIVNVSLKRGIQDQDLRINSEITHSYLTGKSVTFYAEIGFDEYLYHTNYLPAKITPEQIKSSCNAFYRPKMEDEQRKFYQGTESEPGSKQLLQTTMKSNEFLIRMGRFSGVESVTLDKYRNPKPPGRIGVWGTSRNLAEGIYPMGWVKASICKT